MTVGDRILALLEHRRIDAESDAILEGLVGAIGDAADRLGLIAYGDDGLIGPGAALTDPAVAPAWALVHAALYTGGTVPPRAAGELEADWLARAREAVVYPAGMRRGTHAAIRRAVEPHLTGTRRVIIFDQVGGPYDLVVRTRVSETPDPAAVELAIAGSYVSGGPKGAIRAELVLTYVVSDDAIWQEFAAMTWADVAAQYATWNDVLDGPEA